MIRLLSSSAFSVLLLLISAFPASLYAQEGAWRTHTAMRQVVDLDATPEGDVWVATEGGLFQYSVAGSEIARFTRSEGLSGISTRAIAFDAPNNALWIGYGDGVIDRLNVENGTVETFRDVSRAQQFSRREINKLFVTGDTLVIATGFGVLFFDTGRGEVREAFTNFAGLTAPIVTDVVIESVNDEPPRLWVAHQEGISTALLDSPNLQDPAVWVNEVVGATPTSVAGFQGNLYVGTISGLRSRDENGTYASVPSSSQEIFALTPQTDRLVAVEAAGLIIATGPQSARRIAGSGVRDMRDLVASNNLYWIGDHIEGLLGLNPPGISSGGFDVAISSFFPTGPFDGLFTQLEFDDSENLWLAGTSGTGRGFYRLSPEQEWTSFIGRFFAPLSGRPASFFTVHTDTQGNAWAGSDGGALAHIDSDDNITFYEKNNSTLQESVAVPGSDFVRIQGISSEPDGTLWVANTQAAEPLHARLLDGSWHGFLGNVPGVTYERIFVDSFGQKWIILVSLNDLTRREGFIVLDSGADIATQEDDTFRLFNTRGGNGQGLPSVHVNHITEDRSGRVWLSTDEGLAYFINTGLIPADQGTAAIWPVRTNRGAGESQFLLRGLKINSVTIDPANNLWIATDEGAWYVQESGIGFEIRQHFSTENSPLLSDVILSIAVAPSSGEVFFSTDQGLISFAGDAIQAVDSKQDLHIYPNPFVFSQATDQRITIEGLLEETEIRVVTPDGRLVSQIDARGGRAVWDVRDTQGRLVPSGMYLVIAVDQNGEGKAVGKAAVVR